jgi:hypothetical protein
MCPAAKSKQLMATNTRLSTPYCHSNQPTATLAASSEAISLACLAHNKPQVKQYCYITNRASWLAR